MSAFSAGSAPLPAYSPYPPSVYPPAYGAGYGPSGTGYGITYVTPTPQPSSMLSYLLSAFFILLAVVLLILVIMWCARRGYLGTAMREKMYVWSGELAPNIETNSSVLAGITKPHTVTSYASRLASLLREDTQTTYSYMKQHLNEGRDAEAEVLDQRWAALHENISTHLASTNGGVRNLELYSRIQTLYRKRRRLITKYCAKLHKLAAPHSFRTIARPGSSVRVSSLGETPNRSFTNRSPGTSSITFQTASIIDVCNKYRAKLYSNNGHLAVALTGTHASAELYRSLNAHSDNLIASADLYLQRDYDGSLTRLDHARSNINNVTHAITKTTTL